MDRRTERQEQIDKKLLGLTNQEAEWQSDPDWDEQLTDTQLAIDAIEVAEDERLKERLQKLESHLASQPRSQLKVVRDNEIEVGRPAAAFDRRKWLSLAASLLFVLALGYYFLLGGGAATDPGALYAANFEPYRNIAVDLTRSDDLPTLEQAAFTAYEQADYEEANRLLLQSSLPGQVKDFYLAQSQLALGNYAAAISYLEPLTNTQSDFALREQSTWYLALAQVADGQIELGKPLLKRISVREDHPYQAQAKELLKDL
jgi:hypothetical protein